MHHLQASSIDSSNRHYQWVDHNIAVVDTIVRGALNNGVTRDEIAEVFLQVAIYCGVPAAVDSFRIAREVFDEQESAEG